MTIIVGHLLAVAIGLSLGLIGGGGSILAVPILVYVMGVSSKVAIAMSLAIVGTVSVIGAIPHWQQGNVNLKIAIAFIPSAMVGAFLGARITALSFVTDTFQLICFGIIMAIASILLIRKGSRKKAPGNNKSEQKPQSFLQSILQGLAIPLEAFGVGILTGFVGVGGGFLIVPTLVLLAGIPMKEAIGTSLVIIAANSASGFLGYISQVEVDWNLIFSFTLAASSGTLLGAYLTRFIKAKQLQKGFGYFVLAVAFFVLIRR